MQLSSSTDPVYFPEADQPSVLRLGLQPLSIKDWILVDDDLPLFHRHKLDLAEQHIDSVYQQLPCSQPAQLEFAALLLHHLNADHRDHYQLNGSELSHPQAQLRWSTVDADLWHSSLWIQEDICILQSIDKQYCLTAASVCSPSNWKLQDKIGRSLDLIHQPVPGYQDALAERVNRLLDGIKPKKPLQRFNWSIQRGNELNWSSESEQAAADQEKFWRVERQTLLRLPQSGAIVFGIRIFLHSFSTMQKYSHFASTIATILRRLPDEQKRYKGLQ